MHLRTRALHCSSVDICHHCHHHVTTSALKIDAVHLVQLQLSIRAHWRHRCSEMVWLHTLLLAVAVQLPAHTKTEELLIQCYTNELQLWWYTEVEVTVVNGTKIWCLHKIGNNACAWWQQSQGGGTANSSRHLSAKEGLTISAWQQLRGEWGWTLLWGVHLKP